jgi:transposase InsO family protein
MVYAKVPAASIPAVQVVHEQSKRDQFLMKLPLEFEATRSSLMNRDPSPCLDVCFGELLREEQHLLTQAAFQQDVNPNPVAYAAYGSGKGKDMRKIQCYYYKESGHFAANCAKKVCNYCKKRGHLIKDCPTRPQHRHATANQAIVSTYSAPGMSSTSSAVGSSSLTPEMVQQMIMSAFSALGLQGNTSHKSWLIDSAASNHMTKSSKVLCNVRSYHGSSHIQVANGSHLAITKIGDINLSFKDVYVSPGLSNNLLSVAQLVEENYNVHFSRDGCLVQDQVLGMILAKGPKVGRLFPLQFSIPRSLSLACLTVNNPSEVWHKRLGHPNSVIFTRMLNFGLLGNKEHVYKYLPFDCSVCKLGKSKTLLFPSHGSRATKCFDIVHSDVWGISHVVSHARYKYFVTFIDDFSRHTWVYFLRAKSEVLSVFQNFVAYIENQFSTCIRILRSDSGGEYMSHEFHDFVHHKGILSQHSCPYTPQQNGVAEQKNRHLLDVVHTLLLESSIPSKFWIGALSSAAYLINRLPSQVLNFDSPYYRLYHQHPSYLDLHTFGCVCFVHLPPHERHKLYAQSVKCVFLGYSISHKGYVCYDSCANKVRISHMLFSLRINISFLHMVSL